MIRARSGRPLRFLAVLMLGWIGLRVMAQMDFAVEPTALAVATSQHAPHRIVAVAPAPLRMDRPPVQILWPVARSVSGSNVMVQPVTVATKPSGNFGAPTDMLDFIRQMVAFSNRHYASQDMGARPSPIPFATPPPVSKQVPSAPDRWQASGWLLVRPGKASAVQTAPVGRLGGSQAGLRIDYALAPSSPHRPALYARATAALQDPAAPEAAIGLAIRPLPDLPVSIGIERRVALGSGGRNAMAIVGAGGFGPVDIAPGLYAEGYGQAGIVGFRRGDRFVDGRIALLAPVKAGALRIGGAISGGAQPGVSRLDIGPEMQLRLPLPRANARLSIEWRERIAGDAAPPSGLAITLATDF